MRITLYCVDNPPDGRRQFFGSKNAAIASLYSRLEEGDDLILRTVTGNVSAASLAHALNGQWVEGGWTHAILWAGRARLKEELGFLNGPPEEGAAR